MADKTWKRRERQVAKMFGTTRTPLSGGNGKQTRSDTLHPKLFIEQKHRAKHAIITLWDKVKDLAKKERKVPVVVLTQENRKGAWICCHVDDFSGIIEAWDIKQEDE